MASCEDMKLGEVYACESCGLEIEIKKACGCPIEECDVEHHANGECCDFVCCGKEMGKK